MILLLGIAVVPLLVLYIFALSRSVLLGWISLLAVMLYDYTFGANVYGGVGINITLVDIVEICLLVAGGIRTIPRLRERYEGRTNTLAYLAVFAFSMVRGIAAHGFAHAAAGARLFVGFLIAVTYFLTAPVDPQSVRKYVNAYLCYGLALTIVACLAFSGLHVGAIAWAHNDPEIESMIDGRVLPSSCALALAFCFFLSLAISRYRSSGIYLKWLSALFLGLAVALRARSVWVVLAAGIASLLFLDRKLIRRLIPMAALIMFFIAGYALLSGSAARSVEDQLSKSATDDNTWLFRVAMWQSLLQKSQTPTGVLFGQDLGGGYEFFDLMAGRYVDIPPHNEYIAQYLSEGLAGVALLLWFIIRPLRSFWRLSSTDMMAVEPSSSAWVAVIVGIILYSIPYEPMADNYALLAIANAMIFRTNQDVEIGEQKDLKALPILPIPVSPDIPEEVP